MPQQAADNTINYTTLTYLCHAPINGHLRPVAPRLLATAYSVRTEGNSSALQTLVDSKPQPVVRSAPDDM
jgi:hypothetical protein